MLQDEQITLSICTVHHGDERYVRQLVRSIEQYTHDISYKIIVVDNMSNRPALTFPPKSKVTVIKNTEMKGYAANLNVALREAKGEYCVILNNDILILPLEDEKIEDIRTQAKNGVEEIVFPSTNSLCGFDKLVHDFRENPDIDCMGPMILLPDGTIQIECARGIPTIVDQLWELLHLDVSLPSVKFFNHYKMLYWDRRDSREVKCLLGAFIMFRRELLDSVGYLDEGYFLDGEDLDFCLRVIRNSKKIFYNSSVRVLHYGSASIKRVTTSQDMMRSHLSIQRYYRRHFGILAAFVYRTMVTLIVIPRMILLDGFLARRGKPDFETRLEFVQSIFRWRVPKAT